MSTRTSAKRPPSTDSRPNNRLLASLPAADFDRLQPHLASVDIQRRQVFHAPNELIRDVVFLNGGVASVTTTMQDGSMVEVATVGDEGLVGMDVFFGGDSAIGEAMLQVPDGTAEFMPTAVFKAELARGDALFKSVQRYAQGFIALMMHSAACLALHPVQERFCRWMLMTHDRVHRDDFHLSQEFLATMLGSTRPTVSVVASTLQKAGLISYAHGQMRIIDRVGLEEGACECYRTVKSRFDELGL